MSVEWMMVCNDAGARIFRRGTGGPWSLAEKIEHAEGRAHAGDLGSDRPGRMAHATGTPKVALETRTDPREAERERFVHALVGRLDDAVRHERFDQLWIAAPPRMLGLLRGALPKEVERRLVASYDRDYAHAEDADAIARVMELRTP